MSTATPTLPRLSAHVQAGWLLALSYLALRLPFLPRWTEDHDSVNFAFGLQHFDLLAHRPHFPGYPVYLALAWLPNQLGLPAPMALALPGILAGALAVAVLFATLRPLAGRTVALLAAGLYAALPGLWLADATPLSDALGAHLVTLVLCGLVSVARLDNQTVQRSWSWAVSGGALLAGLLLGVRLSSLPVAVLLLAALAWRSQRYRHVASVAAVGVAVWLLPLTWLAGGPAALVDVGIRFLDGHLHTWGNTALAAQPAETMRTLAWLANTVRVLGWPVLAAIAACLVALRMPATAGRAQDTVSARFLLFLVLPYLAWVLVGQNPDKPRHLLPILPFFVMAAALFAGRWLPAAPEPATPRPLWKSLTWGSLFWGNLSWRSPVVMALVVLATAVDAVPRLVTRTQTPSPAVQLAQWLGQQEPEQLLVYGGSEIGVLRLIAPAHRSLRVPTAADLARAQDELRVRPRRLYVTSNVAGLPSLPLVARFPGRPGVDRASATIELFQLLPPAQAAVAEARP